jgi:predicted NAD/FAD-binding protein
MPIGIRMKFWFFEHYWWLLAVAIAGAVTTLLALHEPLPTVATVVGAILSVAYFIQKQKLEEMRLFRELFKECNARYDAMNDDLASIAEMGEAELSHKDRLKVIDYLNLCGEEYLYFKRGYIEPSVWQAWNNGMKAIVAAPAIQRVWQVEKRTGSYYDLPL